MSGIYFGRSLISTGISCIVVVEPHTTRKVDHAHNKKDRDHGHHKAANHRQL